MNSFATIQDYYDFFDEINPLGFRAVIGDRINNYVQESLGEASGFLLMDYEEDIVAGLTFIMKAGLSLADKQEITEGRAELSSRLGVMAADWQEIGHTVRPGQLDIFVEPRLPERYTEFNRNIASILQQAASKAVRRKVMQGWFYKELSEWTATRGYHEVVLDLSKEPEVQEILATLPADWPDLRKANFVKTVTPLLQLRLDRDLYLRIFESEEPAITSDLYNELYYMMRSKSIGFQEATNRELFKIQEPEIRALSEMIPRISATFPNQKIYFYPVKLNTNGYGQDTTELNQFMEPKGHAGPITDLSYYLEFDPAHPEAFVDSFRILANLYFAQDYTLLISPQLAEPRQVFMAIDMFRGMINNPEQIYPMASPIEGIASVPPVITYMEGAFPSPAHYWDRCRTLYFQLDGMIHTLGVSAYRFRNSVLEFYELYDAANNKVPFWPPE